MLVRRLGILSVHTSPLAQPGSGDGGGMNVYVRSLARALARAGVACDVLTRADHPEQPPVVEVEPGVRVLHVEAGPRAPVRRHELAELVEPFTEAAQHLLRRSPVDVLHANYWISGAVAHRMKHELGVPLAATFHTLARVKAEAGLDDDPATRARVEQEVIRCADVVLASTAEERDQLAGLYDADPSRVEIVPPGVDHTVFHPGDRDASRRHLGLEHRRVLLFAGRIQALKGADLAIRCLDALDDPAATLLVVGGPSGPGGAAELARLHELTAELRLEHQVQFVRPQPHHRLADYYRAADVCLVPSRAESFGLVALEAAACGTPVVAAAVGGLRCLVADGLTGHLVEGRSPEDYAAPAARILADPSFGRSLGTAGEQRSRRYSWSITAARLRRLYADLAAGDLVSCV